MTANKWKVVKDALGDLRVIVGVAIFFIALIAAVFAPAFAPTSPGESDITLRLLPPGSACILGCDLDGAEVLTSLLYGARISLYVGFLTVLLSITLGLGLGLLSGYFGGVLDYLIMRLVDLTLAFPGILLAMAVTALLGPSIHNVVLAIAATGWASSARIVRSQVLTLRETDYVTATKALGSGHVRLMGRHILPGIWSVLLIHGTFSLSGVIIVESGLSFLGLGASGQVLSWGGLLAQGKQVITEAPHLSIFPGLAIVLVVLSLNFIGDGLRDVLDPKT